MHTTIFARDTLRRTPLFSTIRAILALRYGMPLNGHKLTFAEVN